MHVIKIVQFIGVAILCLTLIEVNMELFSSCDPLDLRTILVQVRQTQSKNKQLQDKHNMDIDNLHKDLNKAENLASSKFKAIEGKINDSETKNEKQLNSLQGQINESKAEWESQQYLIESLQEKMNVLQIHLNKSETKISELNSLINISETEVKRQYNRLDDIQLRLNKTNRLSESLKTSLEKLNVTFQEINEQIETIQNEFNEEKNGTDGQWSTWSSWSGCSSTSCRKTRNRSCNNPAPSANGHMCEGNSVDVDICDLSLCNAATSCSDILQEGQTKSGVYKVTMWRSKEPMDVLCDMDTDGGGWTVFQHRTSGVLNFTKNFKEYEYGFGQKTGEFWMGLVFIKEVADEGNTEMRMDVTDIDGKDLYEVFDNFSLSSAPDYRLYISPGHGSLGDDSSHGLSYHQGMPFSTNDHDVSLGQCPSYQLGGWWYKACGYINLNAHHNEKMFYFVNGGYKRLDQTKMMLRRRRN